MRKTQHLPEGIHALENKGQVREKPQRNPARDSLPSFPNGRD
jgi:hypothetical protein